MTRGHTKACMLCAIGICDLPYIFANFGQQFPEKQGRHPSSMADSLQLY